jgi:hypothetical protein
MSISGRNARTNIRRRLWLLLPQLGTATAASALTLAPANTAATSRRRARLLRCHISPLEWRHLCQLPGAAASQPWPSFGTTSQAPCATSSPAGPSFAMAPLQVPSRPPRWLLCSGSQVPTQEASHQRPQRLRHHQQPCLTRPRRLLPRLRHERPRCPFPRPGRPRHLLPRHGQSCPPWCPFPCRLPLLRHTVEVKHHASCPSSMPPQTFGSC